jgi:NAD(P)-dependent dehydrogenase (short-subunit alcohol dehydrogenase family)
MAQARQYDWSSLMHDTESGGLMGRTVLVTGGANGIGLCMVNAFAALGADVLAVDIDVEGLDALSSQQPGVRTVVADVSTTEGADATIAAAGPRVDVLCNNAGIVEPILLADELPDEVWSRVLDVNLTAAFLLCARALPLMLAQGGGAIINNASTAGLRGGRGGTAYTVSKFALIGLSENIAATYAAHGIRCNAICPGPVRTEIVAAFELSPRSSRLLSRDAAKPARGSPEEVADVAVFLAQSDGARVNGAAFPIDGGWIAY